MRKSLKSFKYDLYLAQVVGYGGGESPLGVGGFVNGVGGQPLDGGGGGPP
jgi:hypothetical protein